jgi:hypothetical protein
MIDQAIRQGDESVAPGLHMSQLDSGRVEALDTAGAEKSPARRITAESFRLLSARLRKTPVPDFPIKTVPEPAPLPPVVAESVAAPVEIEVEPVQAVAEKPSFPVFETAEIEVEAVEPEIAALAAAPEAGQTETIAAGEIESAQEVVEQPGVPVFLEMPVEAAVTEPGVEEVSQNLELSAETIAPEIIVEEIPVAEPVVAEAPVTETASTPVSSVEVQLPSRFT